MSLTINNLSLPELDVRTLKFVLQNQDDDYAEIGLRKDWKGDFPSPFVLDAPLVFREGSAIRFRGDVAAPTRAATGTDRSKRIVAYGPWRRFKERMFTYSYPYLINAASSTHGVIGGDANSIIVSILTTNASDLVTIGRVDLGSITIPESEVYDQTLAQAIRAVLRYIPGAVVSFDYSTTLPTIHVVADNSAHLVSVPINLAAGDTRDLSIVPRYDRRIDGVQIQWEGAVTVRNGQFSQSQDGNNVDTVSSPPADQNGFWIVGTETAGNLAARRVFRRTIRLSGALDTATYVYNGQIFTYKTLDFGIPGAPGGTNGLQIIRAFGWFFRVFGSSSGWALDPNNTTFYRDNWNALGWVYEVGRAQLSAGGGDNTYSWPAMALGNPYAPPAGWGGTTITPLGISPAVSPSAIPKVFLGGSRFIRAASVGLRWFVYSTISSSWINIETPPILWLDGRDLGTVNPGGTFQFSKQVVSSTIPSFTTGIAAQMFAANNRLLHDGAVTLRLDDPLGVFSGLKRKAVLSPVSVTTPLQRVSIDAFTGWTSLDFGAPEHLGPQDYVALARAGLASR